MTRRELAGAALAVPLAAQAPAPERAVTEKENQAALDNVRRNSETLAKQAVAIEIEPAFQFKA